MKAIVGFEKGHVKMERRLRDSGGKTPLVEAYGKGHKDTVYHGYMQQKHSKMDINSACNHNLSAPLSYD